MSNIFQHGYHSFFQNTWEVPQILQKHERSQWSLPKKKFMLILPPHNSCVLGNRETGISCCRLYSVKSFRKEDRAWWFSRHASFYWFLVIFVQEYSHSRGKKTSATARKIKLPLPLQLSDAIAQSKITFPQKCCWCSFQPRCLQEAPSI